MEKSALSPAISAMRRASFPPRFPALAEDSDLELYVLASQPVKRRRSPSCPLPRPEMADNRRIGSWLLHRRPSPWPMLYFSGAPWLPGVSVLRPRGPGLALAVV